MSNEGADDDDDEDDEGEDEDDEDEDEEENNEVKDDGKSLDEAQKTEEREEKRRRKEAKAAELASARAERARKRLRERKIKKALRKFGRDFPASLAHERDVMLPVMRHLRDSKNDLLRCAQVCKDWNGKECQSVSCAALFYRILMKSFSPLIPADWSHDPSLWTEVTVRPGSALHASILTGIVRRQPHHLDLSWCRLGERQLAWLLPRLPQLVSLKLTGVEGLTLAALHSCNCPLLSRLDLSWTASSDEHVRLLLSRPPDNRPGLMEGRTRLRYLSEVKFTGE